MKRVDYSAIREKRCSRCKETKSVDAFHRYIDNTAPLTGWRYYSRCRDCNKADCRDYGTKSKPKRNARLRAWRRANPAKATAADRRKHVAKYGLTIAGAERMRLSQGGLCKLCRRAAHLVIDHCHSTGRVRGLLCRRCNSMLGWVESRPDMLSLVSAYIGLPCHADVLLTAANEEAAK